MRFDGIWIGAAAFVIIGILHPVVIKVEFHWGTGMWPLFLAAGLACMVASLFVCETVISALLGTLGFSLIWSIRELFEQRQRVKKGWFPK